VGGWGERSGVGARPALQHAGSHTAWRLASAPPPRPGHPVRPRQPHATQARLPAVLSICGRAKPRPAPRGPPLSRATEPPTSSSRCAVSSSCRRFLSWSGDAFIAAAPPPRLPPGPAFSPPLGATAPISMSISRSDISSPRRFASTRRRRAVADSAASRRAARHTRPRRRTSARSETRVWVGMGRIGREYKTRPRQAVRGYSRSCWAQVRALRTAAARLALRTGAARRAAADACGEGKAAAPAHAATRYASGPRRALAPWRGGAAPLLTCQQPLELFHRRHRPGPARRLRLRRARARHHRRHARQPAPHLRALARQLRSSCQEEPQAVDARGVGGQLPPGGLRHSLLRAGGRKGGAGRGVGFEVAGRAHAKRAPFAPFSERRRAASLH
jgi:hypothetical protein